MAGSGLAQAQEDVHSFTRLWSGSKDYAYLFAEIELSSCIGSFEKTANLAGNMYLLEMAMNLLCGFRFAGLDITRTLRRC